MKTFLATACLSVGAMLASAALSPAQPPSAPFAKAMELWTDHPAAPSGEPEQDLERLHEISRQSRLRALQDRIDSERPIHAPKCLPGDLPGMPFPTRLMPLPLPSPVPSPEGLVLRNDNTSQAERHIWRENQHLFPKGSHGSR